MKKSISYRSFPGGLAGEKDIGQCFEEAKQAGFEAVELCCGDRGQLSLKATEKQCAQIRARAEGAGVEIASLASDIYWNYNLASARVTDRNRAEQATKRMLQIAQWLGTDALLFVPGVVDVFLHPSAEVIPYDIVLARAKQGMKRLLKTAEQHEVTLAVENVWNSFLLSPIEMRDFVDSFHSEYVGACFSVGNVVPFGYPAQWIRILGKRIRRVHFKDFKRAVGMLDGFCDLLEGDVDWPSVMKALGAVGYNGCCTAEMTPPYAWHPMVRIENTSRAMDAILGR